MSNCPDIEALVEAEIDKVLTQYRESPKLLHMSRTYLRQIAEVMLVLCTLPEKFDLNTATGEQLTFIGKRMGWPRCHCVCAAQPVHGFDCNIPDPTWPDEEPPPDPVETGSFSSAFSSAFDRTFP